MNDIFDLPDERELPVETKALVRQRILTELDAPGARANRALLPISIAAAVVVLAGAAAGVVVIGNNAGDKAVINPAHATQSPTEGSTASTDAAAGNSGGYYINADQTYNVSQHRAAPDLTARCAAQNHGDRPAASQWQPIMTASGNGVTLIAYHTPAGALFCELTPTTVTLSSVTTGSGNKVTFATQFGSVAGLVDPKYQWLYVRPGTDEKDMALGAMADGVFVAPNSMPVPLAKTTDMIAYTTNQPLGAGTTIAMPSPQVTPAVTDRTAPPVDHSSQAARLLGQCLTEGHLAPVIDQNSWAPGLTLALNSHATLQLGTQAGLLGACVLDSTAQSPEQPVQMQIANGLDANVAQPGHVAANPYVQTGQVFYDFANRASHTYAVVGLLTSSEVTGVRLIQPGAPTIAGTVHNGTLAVPNVDVNIYGVGNTHPSLQLLDSSNNVITTLSLN